MALGAMDVGNQRMVISVLEMDSQYGFLLPFSRKHESEADFIGHIHLATVCFDPCKAPKIWERKAEHN